jgi:23S rRNA pseudouridine1911/1915/1917 synthase
VLQLTGKSRVRSGQVVSVDTAMLPVARVPAADPTIEFEVVFADEQLIVVDKPAGLVVHPGAGNPDHTLVNGLLARYPEIATVGEAHRPGIVHRLDVGTSGLLVVARTERAYHSLVEALAAHDVGRVYRVLVWGHPENPIGVVDAPIGRDHRDPMRMAVVVDGKPARTHYRVLHEFRTPAIAASLECRLETGRTHQIRVHLAAIGHPVVGDGTYGGVRHGIAPQRPFLHAAALELLHPVTAERLHFQSPLPADLAAVEAELGT